MTAAPTIKMLNDSTPAYSARILEDGFAGYAAGSIVSTFCLEAHEIFTPGQSYYAVLNTEAVRGLGHGTGSMAFMARAPDIRVHGRPY